MGLNRNKLYLILFIACLAGYIWIYISVSQHLTENNSVELCPMKHITNIPCPSCGTTRSVISITQGNFLKAFQINPIGIIDALIMFFTPLWILADLLTNRKTLFDFYKKVESYLKKPKYAILFIILIVINWIWNIVKGN